MHKILLIIYSIGDKQADNIVFPVKFFEMFQNTLKISSPWLILHFQSYCGWCGYQLISGCALLCNPFYKKHGRYVIKKIYCSL